MSCEQIHETVIGEIEEVIKGAKELRKDNKMLGNKSWSSIAKATSNLTLTFPVLISRNVPIETAQIVTKACERDDVSMLQVLFSAMSITQAEDGLEYIKKIHTNLNLGDKIDLDAFINAMDSTPVKENMSYIDAYDIIKEDMKNINHTLDDSISETGLNNYQLFKENGNLILLKEEAQPMPEDKNLNDIFDEIPQKYRDAAYLKQFAAMTPDEIFDYEDNNNGRGLANLYFATIPLSGMSPQQQQQYMKQDLATRMRDANLTNARNIDDINDPLIKSLYLKYSLDQMSKDNLKNYDLGKLYLDIDSRNIKAAQFNQSLDDKEAEKIRQQEIDKRKYRLDAKNLALSRAKFRYQKEIDQKKQELDDTRAIQQYQTDLFNRNSRMLIDSDVKKANEMIPTLMNVQFTKVVNNYPVVSSMIVGVKAKMVPLDSQDIMNRIINKNKDNNFFIKFFRATTREISFVKDFVLAIDKSKSDALSFSKKGKSNKIWKILERRSKKSSMSKIFNTNNSAMAISTLIITSEEVEALKKMNNIDMNDPKIAGGIMQSYNLMAFGIVDDMMQTFKIMKDDGDNTYTTYAYSALEKEMSDSARKTIVNLAAKNNLKI